MAANNKVGVGSRNGGGSEDEASLHGELVALILQQLDKSGYTKGGGEDVRRALDKRRRKWRKRHIECDKQRGAGPSLDPTLRQDKEVLDEQCMELRERLVGRRREAYGKAREERSKMDVVRRDLISGRLESFRLSLETYRGDSQLSSSAAKTTEERESQSSDELGPWGEELCTDLERNVSQAKALSTIRHMKLHMTPRLPALSPQAVTPSLSRTAADVTSTAGVEDQHTGAWGGSGEATDQQDTTEVGGEMWIEDRVPEIGRMVEGTLEELQGVSLSGQSVEDGYIHQSTGCVLMNRATDRNGAGHNASTPFVHSDTSQAAMDGTSGMNVDIDISVVELSVCTSHSPTPAVPSHNGGESQHNVQTSEKTSREEETNGTTVSRPQAEEQCETTKLLSEQCDGRARDGMDDGEMEVVKDSIERETEAGAMEVVIKKQATGVEEDTGGNLTNGIGTAKRTTKENGCGLETSRRKSVRIRGSSQVAKDCKLDTLNQVGNPANIRPRRKRAAK